MSKGRQDQTKKEETKHKQGIHIKTTLKTKALTVRTFINSRVTSGVPEG